MSQDDWPWKHISIPYDLLTSTGVLDVRFLQPDFYIYNLLSVIIWRVLTYLITYKTQRSSQCQICSIVNCFLFWYFNDCSVKILPSSSSPIEKTFAMFLYLLPTRSVLLTCLLRTIKKQNMNYMYKFCPNMYLISVKRHFHSIWTHQTFTDFNNTDFEFWRSYIIKQINAYLATCTIIFIFCGNLIKSDKCFGVTFLTCLMVTLKDSPFLCLVFILYIIC